MLLNQTPQTNINFHNVIFHVDSTPIRNISLFLLKCFVVIFVRCSLPYPQDISALQTLKNTRISEVNFVIS